MRSTVGMVGPNRPPLSLRNSAPDRTQRKLAARSLAIRPSLVMLTATRRSPRSPWSGFAVKITSDGLMAKLRAASFRCVLSGAEFRSDSGGRFGPTIPTVERIDPDGPYSDDNTRVVCLGVDALRGHGSIDDNA